MKNEAAAREAIDKLLLLLQKYYCADNHIMRARWGGHLIFLSAEIYDWCYSYISKEEKEYIISKCEQIAEETFEMGYPPLKQTALSGHGCEAQLLRDLLSFSIAVYDERPDIYDICAGRILNEYVETNAFHFAGHGHMQGPSYGAYRYTYSLWAAMLFEKMSGVRIFHESLEKTAEYFYYTLRSDGEMFRLGDDRLEVKAKWLRKAPIVAPMFFAGAYASDNRYLEYFNKHCTYYHLLSENWGLDFYQKDAYGEGILSPVTILLWNRPELMREKVQSYKKCRYFSYPLGMTVWKDDQTAVLMKIGELWGANHDHLDMGCFQIYHHKILVSDSGICDGYFSDHRQNYLIRTSAHNCITVKDPNSDPDDWEAADGGMRRPMDGAEPKNIKDWEENYQMARVISHEETEDYCEITGDLSKAYEKTCESVIRKMEFDRKQGTQGILIVTDRIRAKSETYIKSFHVHVQTEPEIIGNDIYIRNGEGRLKCSVVYPENAKISIVGGNGKEFMVDGINHPAFYTDRNDAKPEVGWGQVIIQPKGKQKEDIFVVKFELL